ncbi:MAG TPA: hypothetical protein VN947_03590 [Polyangia bacterium]|nr:hypothetical protein [Polyangia bacterium]
MAALLVGWSGCSPVGGPINHGTGGNAGSAGSGGGGDGSPDLSVDDSGDGGTAYNADFAVNSMCVPPQMATQCDKPIPSNAGCQASEDCGANGMGNGLDDNCNGTVDEGCVCRPGDVEKCFIGPPGRRGVGGCTDGSATCAGNEFGSWGPCIGSIGPQNESCDKLDNDCNGCADDGLCCNAAIDCPAPGDPRIAPKPPYTDVPLKGELFFPGAATSWSWTVVGGPCDQLFYSTTMGHNQSFTLTGANTKDAVAHFTLSGDYTVTLTVVGADGQTYSCTWVQHIIGPGVRFELCWDHSDSEDDIDLHVHKPGTTTAWFSTTGSSSNNNPDDCFYYNCKASEYPTPGTGDPIPDWGYANSAIAQCIGSPEGADWMNNLGACHNPRLDIDNVGGSPGTPENINIDDPKNGDSFRAAVHYYSSSSTTDEHPMVNIYCGGTLKATFGKAPNTLTGFNNGLAYGKGLLWRVADVAAIVDSTGNTTDCTVTAIHPPGTSSGYYTTNNNMSY